MKKLFTHRRRMLVMTAILISSVLIAVDLCCKTMTADPNAPTQASDDLADWMANHLDVLGPRTLKEITLPASHDSAMYQTSFPQSLARTQNLSIYAQLTAGVRYFDLRPRSKDSVVLMHHGLINGPSLTTVLDEVRRFMSEGHRELIIVKLSHADGLNAANYDRITREINTSIGPWLYSALPHAKRLAEIPLAEYLEHRGCVLVLVDGLYDLQNPSPGIWIYRDWDSRQPEQGDLRVYDQYSDTMSVDTMIHDQLDKFAGFDGHCKNRVDLPCDLFLLSWTLTPPTDVPRFAASANQHLVHSLQALKMPNQNGCRINLVYLDCVDKELCKAAISLNFR